MRLLKIYIFVLSCCLFARSVEMAIEKRVERKTGKKHGKVVAAKRTRSRVSGRKSTPKTTRRSEGSQRKLDLKSRAKNLRVWQAHMEAARLECMRLDIGAVSYLSPKNNVQQLPDCPLTWKDKTRLAANLKQGFTPRRGEHMQHLTDAEEHDVAIEMVKSAHARNPRTWRSMEEVVAETIANRQVGPAGRAFTRPSRQGAMAARNGRAGFKWRHAFIGRNTMKDFNPEDLGQSRARACNEFAMFEHLGDLLACKWQHHSLCPEENCQGIIYPFTQCTSAVCKALRLKKKKDDAAQQKHEHAVALKSFMACDAQHKLHGKRQLTCPCNAAEMEDIEIAPVRTCQWEGFSLCHNPSCEVLQLPLAYCKKRACAQYRKDNNIHRPLKPKQKRQVTSAKQYSDTSEDEQSSGNRPLFFCLGTKFLV